MRMPDSSQVKEVCVGIACKKSSVQCILCPLNNERASENSNTTKLTSVKHCDEEVLPVSLVQCRISGPPGYHESKVDFLYGQIV